MSESNVEKYSFLDPLINSDPYEFYGVLHKEQPAALYGELHRTHKDHYLLVDLGSYIFQHYFQTFIKPILVIIKYYPNRVFLSSLQNK